MNVKDIIKILLIGSGVLKGLYSLKGSAITIVRYHSVLDRKEDYEGTIGSSLIHSIGQFHDHMEIISRHYNPISMDDVLSHIENDDLLPPYPVVITFDDGFKDNLDNAAPILDKFDIPATFYIIADSVASHDNNTAWFMRVRKAFCDTEKSTWVDAEGKAYCLSSELERIQARRAAMSYCSISVGKAQLERVADIERSLDVPCYEAGLKLMLSWDEIRELRRSGHIIGSHTMSHPNLAYVKEDEARSEMELSKIILEKNLGEDIKHFAYPNPILKPNWNEQTYRLSEDVGYKTAVTCENGSVMHGDNPLFLKRIFAPLFSWQLRWSIEKNMNGL